MLYRTRNQIYDQTRYGGGARRQLRSPPTVPAQVGQEAAYPMLGCDLSTTRSPGEGATSCPYCRAGEHHAPAEERRDGREATRLAQDCQWRGRSANGFGRPRLGRPGRPDAGLRKDRTGCGLLHGLAYRRGARRPRHPSDAAWRRDPGTVPQPGAADHVWLKICAGAALPGQPTSSCSAATWL
jgi:hypothetical protein